MVTDINQLSNLESSGKTLLDLGLQPVSNRFTKFSCDEKAPKFPLQLRICEETGLIHLAKPFPVEEVKPKYDWLTCFEPEAHLDKLVKKIINLPGINKKSVFGGYSFKDDSTLNRIKNLGFTKTWRIDPVTDLGVTDNCAGIETYQSVFNLEKSENIKIRNNPADVLIVRHVVEHACNLPTFLKSIKNLIKPDGYIVWELPDCENAIARGDCTTIWEEHIFYFTAFTFRQLMLAAGFSVIDFDIALYPLENSLIFITQKKQKNITKITIDNKAILREVERAKGFSSVIEQRKLNIRKKLEYVLDAKGPITLLGAGHLSVAFLSILDLTDLISCALDDDNNKRGMKMPIGNLKILGTKELYYMDSSVCLLSLNPQNQPKVIANHERYIGQGGMFASIFPESKNYLEEIL